MIWDTLPERVRKHYRWESGELYENKKCISNYYIKPIRYLNHPEGKTIVQFQCIVGEGEEVYGGVAQLSQATELAVPERAASRCVEFSRTAGKELLAFLKLQLPGLPRKGWYLDAVGWHWLSGPEGETALDGLEREEPDLNGLGGSFSRGRWVYCAGRDVFPETLSEEILVDERVAGHFCIRKGLPAAVSFNFGQFPGEAALLEKVKELIFFGHPVLCACLLYLITGLLRRLFFSVNVPPKFLLYISGDTGTYKTTLANYFFDMYQGGEGVSFASADLTSSEAALQGVISQFKDCTFILDDLSRGIRSQETARKENSLNNLIRTAANCEERYVKSGSRIQGEMAGCQLAVTAEYTLEVESIMNRTVLADLNRMPISREVLRFLASDPFLIHGFSRLFIRWSAEYGEEICRYIRASWEGYRMDLGDGDAGSIPRLRDSIYILAISCGVLMDCFRTYQVETGEMDQLVWEALQRIRQEQERQLLKMRPEGTGYNIAREIVALLHSKKTAVVSSAAIKVRAADCLERDGYLYITPDSLLAALGTVVKDENLTKNKISAYLKKNHLLEMDKSKDSTVKWNGIRYYKINCAALEEAAGMEMGKRFKG